MNLPGGNIRHWQLEAEKEPGGSNTKECRSQNLSGGRDFQRLQAIPGPNSKHFVGYASACWSYEAETAVRIADMSKKSLMEGPISNIMTLLVWKADERCTSIIALHFSFFSLVGSYFCGDLKMIGRL